MVTLVVSITQKERDHGKEMKRKNEEMKAKIYSLRSQKMELDRRVLEMQSTMDSLKEEQRVMESAFEEKQNEIKLLQEKVSDLEKENPEFIALKEKFQQKEAEMEDLKHRFEEALKSRGVRINNSTILADKMSENGTMALAAHEKTQTENKQRDEQSHDQATNYEDGEGITNEDASKNKLTKFDVDEEIQKREGNNDRLTEPVEQNKRQEILQVDDGDTAKEMNENIVESEENASIRQEQGEKFKNETTGGGQEFSLKQLEDNPKIAHAQKRKHVRLGRTKGKRWRTIVKNSLLGNNGISESHGAANVRSRKLKRDQQNDSKNDERGEAEMGNDNPSENKAEEQLQKPGSYDDLQDERNKIVNDISHQVTDNDIGVHQREQTLDEDSQSEKQEESEVEQSWSRRHVNLEEMNAGNEKIGALHKELEEPEAADVQEEKDDIDRGDDEDKDDDFSKESQPDIADADEYKGEVHELESQAGL